MIYQRKLSRMKCKVIKREAERRDIYLLKVIKGMDRKNRSKEEFEERMAIFKWVHRNYSYGVCPASSQSYLPSLRGHHCLKFSSDVGHEELHIFSMIRNS